MENTVSENQRKSVLEKNSRNICMQLGELQKTANELLQRNRKKYEQILKQKPVFDYRLYKINQNQTLSKGAGRELLLRQMDKLLEEQNLLDRQLSIIRIQNENVQAVKQELLNSEITPYQTLRTIWKKASTQHDSPVDHIESLNDIVGRIKHSLKKITQIQSNCSQQSSSEYLKYYAIERCAGETCNNCGTLQQSKNQLRIKYETLQKDYALLKNKNEEISHEISKKDEQIRKLTTKMLERESDAQRKLLYLEERLIIEEQQVKQLKKFKDGLQKNVFYNSEENYQIFINTDRDLSEYTQCISLQLNCLLEFLSNNQIIPEEQFYLNQNPFELQQEQVEVKLPEERDVLVVSNEFIIPELSFGTMDKSRQKALTKKASVTDRPRTERLKTSNSRLQSIEDLEISSKKYIRTNQLTTKRNNRPNVMSFLENRCNTSTVKMSDSPKNMEEER